MEKKDNASCDPGWNDPPLFSYESQTAQQRSSKPKTLLNKRVAFPLHNASPPKTSNCIPVDPTAPLPACSISTLPPPPPAVVIPAKALPVESNVVPECDALFDTSHALDTVMSNLYDVLNVKFDRDDKDKTEIYRRLEAMKRMWMDNKLSRDVQQRLLELTEVLKNNDTERADDLQKGLMVDHAPTCSPWMSGVRHLIHHKEQSDQSAEQDIENTHQSSPVQL